MCAVRSSNNMIPLPRWTREMLAPPALVRAESCVAVETAVSPHGKASSTVLTSLLTSLHRPSFFVKLRDEFFLPSLGLSTRLPVLFSDVGTTSPVVAQPRPFRQGEKFVETGPGQPCGVPEDQRSQEARARACREVSGPRTDQESGERFREGTCPCDLCVSARACACLLLAPGQAD